MKIPYSEIELHITLAMLSQDEKRLHQMEKKMDELEKNGKMIWNKQIKDRKEFNEKAAVFHGITVETLVNSKNYKILCDEYHAHLCESAVQTIMETFKFTHKEAWTILAGSIGLLD